MDSQGPQGRSVFDSLSLASGASLPVEFQNSVSSPVTTTAATLSNTPGTQEEPTRRSGRAIKRKKFDDEFLDSSSHIFGGSHSTTTTASTSHTVTAASTLTSTQPQSPQPTTSGGRMSPSSPAGSLFSVPARSSAVSASRVGKGGGKKSVTKKGTSAQTETNRSSSNLKKLKQQQQKKKPRKDEAWKDLGRWKPTDDLALITGVLQTNDLTSVHRGTKFSCHFTFNEVESRWRAIMFNPIISKLAVQAIRNLPPELVLAVQRKTLLSPQERDALATVKSNRNPSPTLSEFNDLLTSNPGVFHHARTPECLQRLWQALRQYNLLPDQTVQPLPKDNHILNFLDAEASIIDSELNEPRDDFLYHEMALADRKAKREIRHLEAEVQKWQILVDAVRGDNPPDFDNQTLAVLRGRLVRYLMRSKEITFGRSTKDENVDVDLKLEGPAWKISRRQGVIQLKTSGEFFITNEGKRHIFVDGAPIRRGNRVRLNNNSVLEISGLKFVFLINQDLIEAIRQEATRLYHSAPPTPAPVSST